MESYRYSGKIRPSKALIKTLFYLPSLMFCVSYAIICYFSTPTNLGVWWSCDWLMPGPFPAPYSKATRKVPPEDEVGELQGTMNCVWTLVHLHNNLSNYLTRFKGIIKAFSRMRVWLTSITFPVIWSSVLISVTWVALLWAGLSVLPN